MTIKEKILETLNTTRFHYKGIPINAFFLPVFEESKIQSVRNSFNQLYKDGYLEKSNGYFLMTSKGKRILNQKKKQLLKNFKNVENLGPKNLLLLYDIPENKKNERDWFRRTLIKFGFIMIQRSVWVGPSPLPKEFLDYVKFIGIDDGIKTFKLEKGYNKV